MFATIKSLIPEPRQAEQPRHYVGRHRQPETVAARAAVPVIPAPTKPADGDSRAAAGSGTAAPEPPAPSATPAAASTPAHDPGEPADESGPRAS